VTSEGVLYRKIPVREEMLAFTKKKLGIRNDERGADIEAIDCALRFFKVHFSKLTQDIPRLTPNILRKSYRLEAVRGKGARIEKHPLTETRTSDQISNDSEF